MTKSAHSRMRRFLFSAAALMLLAPTVAARAADQVKISYVLPVTIYGDLFLGVDKGYFAEEGIEAELIPAGGGTATPALIAGDIQFSGSPAAAISAILKGAKLKVLFISADHSAYQLWSRPEIKTLDDLKGQQVGVITRGDTTEIAMRYYLAKHGLATDYVSYTPLGPGAARAAAITAGSLGGSLLDTVELEDLKSAGKLGALHLLVDLRREVRMTFSGLATSDALIASNPELVRRTVRAIMKGMAYTKTYREETIASVMRHGVKDHRNAEADYAESVEGLSLTGTTPEADQQFELQLRGELLGLPKDKIAPAAQVFDFSFAEKAAAELAAEKWEVKR
jgi:ABC-type nitrate/sulfonate/bicarbonate transport system substrate-binding protein